jgi:hypothetical protein
MIKKFEDVERMNFIMFNVEQLTLFNLFSKYNVSKEINHLHNFAIPRNYVKESKIFLKIQL